MSYLQNLGKIDKSEIVIKDYSPRRTPTAERKLKRKKYKRWRRKLGFEASDSDEAVARQRDQLPPEMIDLNDKIKEKVANIDKEINELVNAKQRDKLRQSIKS